MNLPAQNDLAQEAWGESPDAMFATGSDGKVLSWNRAAEEIFGFTPAQAIGQSMLDLIVVAERHDEECRIEAAAARDRRVAVYESVRSRKDGRLVDVSVSSRAVYDPTGQLRYTLSTNKDITDLKRYERALQDSGRLQSELLADMSHELRTPLNGIIGFSEFLMDEKPGALNSKQKEYLGDILASGRDLLRLIGGILDLSKVAAERVAGDALRLTVRDTGIGMSAQDMERLLPMVEKIAGDAGAATGLSAVEAKELDFEILDLEELLDDVLATLVRETRGRPIQWIRSTLPSLRADATLLRHVFVSLIANALKFARTRNPAVIEVGTREGRVGETVFFVRDNGVGFDMEMAGQLASVRMIIHRHGGEVWVQAAVGAGATVYFSLPTSVPAMHAQALPVEGS